MWLVAVKKIYVVFVLVLSFMVVSVSCGDAWGLILPEFDVPYTGEGGGDGTIPASVLIVAVGSEGTILTSSDYGEIWSSVSAVDASIKLFSVIFDGNDFVIGGENSTIMFSKNAQIWTDTNTDATYLLWVMDLFYDGTTYYAAGTSGFLLSTDTLANPLWLKERIFDRFLNGIVSDGTVLVASGFEAILVRNEAGNWTTITRVPTPRRVVYGNNTFTQLGPNGKIFTSTNQGTLWVDRSINPATGTKYTTATLFGGVYIGNDLIVVGGGGVMLRSEDDGGTWYSINSDPITGIAYTTKELISIAVKESFMVVVGTEGTILVSMDGGMRWEVKDSGIIKNLRAVAIK